MTSEKRQYIIIGYGLLLNRYRIVLFCIAMHRRNGEETFPNKQEELLQEKRLRWSLRKNPAEREMKIERNKQVRWNKVKWRRNARSFRNLNKTLKEEERNVPAPALSVEGASQLNQA
ncbi:hypothetical protein PO909_007617 [Leuciscus waleckii]